MSRNQKPLIYACAGYSSAAQMSYHLALALDAAGVAEMSCVAGVGGGVPALTRTARSGRPVVTLDGCPLRCAAACLERADVTPALAVNLADHGVVKRRGVSLDAALAETLQASLAAQIEVI